MSGPLKELHIYLPYRFKDYDIIRKIIIKILNSCLTTKGKKPPSKRRNSPTWSTAALKVLKSSSKPKDWSPKTQFSNSTRFTCRPLVHRPWPSTPKSFWDTMRFSLSITTISRESSCFSVNRCRCPCIFTCSWWHWITCVRKNRRKCSWNLPWKARSLDAMHRPNLDMALMCRVSWQLPLMTPHHKVSSLTVTELQVRNGGSAIWVFMRIMPSSLPTWSSTTRNTVSMHF